MTNVYFNLNQMQHPCRRTMVGWTGTPSENREKIEPRECGLTHDHHGTISYAQPNHTPTQSGRESGARVAKYVAMIFAVLVMSMANVGMAWADYYLPTSDEVIILNSVYKAANTTSGYSTHSAVSWAGTASSSDRTAGDPNNGGAATSSTVECFSIKGNGGGKDITLSVRGCTKVIIYHESHSSRYVQAKCTPKGESMNTVSGSISTYYTEVPLNKTKSYSIFLHGTSSGSDNTDLYVYAVKLIRATTDWYAEGSWDSWGEGFDFAGAGVERTATIGITTAGNYEFKLYDVVNDAWYGNGGKIGCNISNWEFSSGGSNCTFFASETGDYTFTFNTSTKELSVTYPTAQGKYYYKNSNTWGTVAVYRYVGDKNSGWPGSVLVETETICGETYYFTYADPGTTLIFNNNNGGSQTGDMAAFGNANKYVEGTGSAWNALPTYTVSYNANGGSGSMDSHTGVLCGATQELTANSFTRSGWDFTGWNTNKYGKGTDYEDGDEVTVNGNITLYAQWEKTVYMQATGDASWWYNANAWFAVWYYDSSSDSNQDWAEMTLAPCETNVYKVTLNGSGYDKVAFVRKDPANKTLVTWDNKWNHTTHQDYPTTNDKFTITGGTEDNCTGSWGIYSSSSKTITFDSGTGSGSMDAITGICAGEDQTLPTCSFTAPTGYHFDSWAASTPVTVGGSLTSEVADEATLQDISASVTLTAQWTPLSYTITLAKGEYGVSDQSATIDFDATSVTAITHVTSIGYNLTGYYDGSTKVLNADGTFASTSVAGYITDTKWKKAADCTLTAKWTPKTTSITLNANTENHGSTDGSATATYASGNLTSLTHATPTDGYELDGYYTSATSGIKIIDADGSLIRNTTYTTDEVTPKWNSELPALTLYAQYDVVCYDTIYNLTAGVGSEKVTADNATVTSKTSLVLSNTAGRITLKPKTGKFKNGDAISFGGTIGNTSKKYGIIIYDATGTKKNTIQVNGTTSPLKTSGTLTLSSDADSIFISRADGTTTTLTSCIIKRRIDCPEVLDAPTDLVVDDESITSTSLTFTWTEVENASSYDVYLYSDVDCKVQIGDKINVTTTSKTFTGLIPETTYYCKVQAVGDGLSYLNSEFSSKASGTTDSTPVYTLTFNKGTYGTGDQYTKIKYGSVNFDFAEATPLFTREGYEQTGWNTNTDGTSGTSYALNGTYTANADQTFYPVWTQKQTAAKGSYTNGSFVISPTTAIEGETIALTATPDDDYLFTSWVIRKTSDASDVTTSVSLSSTTDAEATFTMPAYGVTVDATFTAIDFCSSFTPENKTASITADEQLTGTGTAKVKAVSVGSAESMSYTINGIRVSASGDVLEVELPNNMKEGSIIKLELLWNGSATDRGFELQTSGGTKVTDMNWQADGNETQNIYYTITSSDGLKNTDKFRLARNTGSMYLKSLSIGECGSEIAMHSLTMAVNDEDYGSASAVATTIKEGRTTTITATPEVGYVFSTWAVTGTGASLGSATTNPTTFTMGTADATVTAIFSEDPTRYSVTYDDNEASSGSVPDDDNEYKYGATVTVKGNIGSLAKTDAEFVGWTYNGTLYLAGQTFTITENTTLTAVWASESAGTTYYYGSISITTGALTPGSTGGYKGFFTNDGGTIASSSAISLTSTPSEGGYYYNSSAITHTELNKSTNWSKSSTSSRTIRSFKFGSGTDYTLALGTKVVTSIMFYGFCGSASKKMSIGGVEFTSSATKETFESHEFTKSGNFTGSITISQDGDFYGILVISCAGSLSGYTVTFDKGGQDDATGMPADIVGVPSGKKIATPLETPTVDGYSFDGWVTTSGGSTLFDFANSTITGNTTIYAKWVEKALTGISVSDLDLYVGGTGTPAVTKTPTDGLVKSQSWAVKDASTNVITINSTTGEVTAVAPGTKTVVATFVTKDDEEITGEATVTVNWAELSTITISPAEVTIAEGGSQILTAVFNAGVNPSTAVTWSSSDTDVATVSSTGEVTARKEGTVTITCSATATPSIKGTRSVTVSNSQDPQGYVWKTDQTACYPGFDQSSERKIVNEDTDIAITGSNFVQKSGGALNTDKKGTNNFIITPKKSGVVIKSIYFYGKIENTDGEALITTDGINWSEYSSGTTSEQIYKWENIYAPAFGMKNPGESDADVNGIWIRNMYIELSYPFEEAVYEDGEWRYGREPDESRDVQLTDNITISSVIKAKSIEIADTKKITITSAGALVVSGAVTREDGTAPTASDLVLESTSDGNGTLIFDNSNSAAATVQMYSKAKAEGGWTWQYIAAPAAVSALDNYYGGYLYKWVESSWAAVGRDATMELFAGYCVSYPTAGHTFAIEGTLAPTTNKSISVPAGKSMVVGNSWTAPIQITQLEEADFSGLLKNVYLYNTGNDEAGEASTTNTPTGDAIYAAGTYISVPIHSASYFDVKVISSLQGFFVKDDHEVEGGGTLKLSYSKHVRPSGGNSVVNGAMHAPKRVADETDRPAVLKMKVSGSQYDDRLILLEREDFTSGYDAGWDGDKMGDVATSPRITTTREDGTADAVAALPDLEGTLINFRAASTDDQYTLYFDYETEDTEPLYLLDLTNNAYTRVETGSSYTFFTTDKADHKRFALTRYRAPQITTGVEDTLEDNGQGKAVKFIENDKLYILRNGVLYDGTGKKVIEN